MADDQKQGHDVGLRKLITCVADNYAWNEQFALLRELATLLRELAEEADALANDLG